MKHSVDTPFGKTKIYDAGTTSSKEYAMVVPGYSETLAHNKSLVDALAKQGFEAFTFSQPRKRGRRSIDPVQRQGEIVLCLVDTELPKDRKVHAVAHSLGSAAVLKAARQAPERFASITLMQPVGLAGEQSFTELAGRASKKVAKNQLGALRSQNPARLPRHGYKAAIDTESALHYSGRVAHAQLAGPTKPMDHWSPLEITQVHPPVDEPVHRK